MTISVSQLNKYVSFVLSEDSNLQNIMVRGEISNFVRNSKSGHCYFTLKDSNSSIKAVMFNSYAYALKFCPENGMSVVVKANASLYERDGAFQLYVTDIEQDGYGDLLLQFEKLKTRLAQEGLFAEGLKKVLPKFPQKIGVIASKTGAALQDVINILSRRYPIGELIIIPASVQGDSAPDSICNALEISQSCKCDVVIIARGGGSFEDLNCFNSEKVARAVFDCQIPVISAIGHETDFTICDFVADLRAPTPSAAAELCAADIDSIYDNLFMLNASLDTAITRKIAEYKMQLDLLDSKLVQSSIDFRLEKNFQKLDMLKLKLDDSKNRIIESCENTLFQKITALENLNPLNVLKRGYSVVCDENGKIIDDSKSVNSGDRISIKLAKGEISAVVDLCE